MEERWAHNPKVLRSKLRFAIFSLLSRLAQLVERKTLNLVVMGSSPTVGVLLVFVEVGVIVRALHRLGKKACAIATWMVGWPSGLKRQSKALVSSEAWVRIPLQSVFASPQHLEVDARRQSKVAHGHAKRPFPKEKKTTTSKRKDK